MVVCKPYRHAMHALIVVIYAAHAAGVPSLYQVALRTICLQLGKIATHQIDELAALPDSIRMEIIGAVKNRRLLYGNVLTALLVDNSECEELNLKHAVNIHESELVGAAYTHTHAHTHNAPMHAHMMS